MSNIIHFPVDPLTNKDLDASTILRNLADEQPANTFVIIWPNDGQMPSYHSSTADVATILMRLNQFIHKYYSGEFDIL